MRAESSESLDSKTIEELEQMGALKKNWKDKTERDKRIRAKFLELSRGGMRKNKAIELISAEFNMGYKNIEKIIYIEPKKKRFTRQNK